MKILESFLRKAYNFFKFLVRVVRMDAGNCRHWDKKDSSCLLLKRAIDPNSRCKLWKKRSLIRTIAHGAKANAKNYM